MSTPEPLNVGVSPARWESISSPESRDQEVAQLINELREQLYHSEFRGFLLTVDRVFVERVSFRKRLKKLFEGLVRFSPEISELTSGNENQVQLTVHREITDLTQHEQSTMMAVCKLIRDIDEHAERKGILILDPMQLQPPAQLTLDEVCDSLVQLAEALGVDLSSQDNALLELKEVLGGPEVFDISLRKENVRSFRRFYWLVPVLSVCLVSILMWFPKKSKQSSFQVQLPSDAGGALSPELETIHNAEVILFLKDSRKTLRSHQSTWSGVETRVSTLIYSISNAQQQMKAGMGQVEIQVMNNETKELLVLLEGMTVDLSGIRAQIADFKKGPLSEELRQSLDDFDRSLSAFTDPLQRHLLNMRAMLKVADVLEEVLPLIESLPKETKPEPKKFSQEELESLENDVSILGNQVVKTHDSVRRLKSDFLAFSLQHKQFNSGHLAQLRAFERLRENLAKQMTGHKDELLKKRNELMLMMPFFVSGHVTLLYSTVAERLESVHASLKILNGLEEQLKPLLQSVEKQK